MAEGYGFASPTLYKAARQHLVFGISHTKGTGYCVGLKNRVVFSEPVL